MKNGTIADQLKVYIIIKNEIIQHRNLEHKQRINSPNLGLSSDFPLRLRKRKENNLTIRNTCL